MEFSAAIIQACNLLSGRDGSSTGDGTVLLDTGARIPQHCGSFIDGASGIVLSILLHSLISHGIKIVLAAKLLR